MQKTVKRIDQSQLSSAEGKQCGSTCDKKQQGNMKWASTLDSLEQCFPTFFVLCTPWAYLSYHEYPHVDDSQKV